MARKKLTIELVDSQLDEIRALVKAGGAASVSAFVLHAIRVAIDDRAGWQEMLHDALAETGGPLTEEERVWADSVLTSRPEPRRNKRGVDSAASG
ncbi:MAG: hypothetical protein JNM66_31785 [Bryobacterales bacterium]|nr:hypothetical protein [Bryobacterales bacterium]